MVGGTGSMLVVWILMWWCQICCGDDGSACRNFSSSVFLVCGFSRGVMVDEGGREESGEAMMTIVGKGGVVVFSNALFY